jgi:hypothetical protein
VLATVPRRTGWSMDADGAVSVHGRLTDMCSFRAPSDRRRELRSSRRAPASRLAHAAARMPIRRDPHPDRERTVRPEGIAPGRRLHASSRGGLSERPRLGVAGGSAFSATVSGEPSKRKPCHERQLGEEEIPARPAIARGQGLASTRAIFTDRD